jgi:hypothetical protein
MIVLRKKSGSESERSGRICVLVGCGMGNHESMGGTRGRKEEPGAKKKGSRCSERTEATGQEGLQLFCWG